MGVRTSSKALIPGLCFRCLRRSYHKSVQVVESMCLLASRAAKQVLAWLPSQPVVGNKCSRGSGTVELARSLPEFSELVPPPSDSSCEPWCLPLLRTEARLRLGAEYIGQTRRFFDAGQPPPPHLDEQVEMEALRLHGHHPSESALTSYRAAVRALSVQQRAPFFFLRANDQLCRPHVSLVGRPLGGRFYDISKTLR